MLGEDGFAEKGNAGKTAANGKRWAGRRLGIGYVDQVEIAADGTLKFIRRDNGDADGIARVQRRGKCR